MHPQRLALIRRPHHAFGVLSIALSVTASTPAIAQFGGGGGGSQPEIQIADRFDENKDGILDVAERATARSAVGMMGLGFAGRVGGGRGFNTGPGRPLTPADVRSYPANVSLYDATAFRTIFFQFENSDWEDELAAFFNTDVQVPATVTVDGKVYSNVGVQFRGMSSYRQVPMGAKHSLNVSFDFAVDGQALGGYRTLNLLNSNSDPTFVRTMLYAHISKQYLPTPRVNYVRVVINGESWGTYVSAQQFNKDFTEEFFDSDEGARWKVPGSPRGRGGMEYLGDNPAFYRGMYEIKSRDDPADWAALIEMFRVLNQTPPDRLEAALRPILDVDGVLRFLALDVALANSDGYWTRASDYNIYRDEDGLFHVVPHDMNEGLGVGVSAQLDPLVALYDSDKPLRSKLLVVPALRDRYLAYVREIADKWLDWETVGPLVQGYQALIAEEVQLDTRKLYTTDAFLSGVSGPGNTLQSFLNARRAFLLTRLDALRTANAVAATGVN